MNIAAEGNLLRSLNMLLRATLEPKFRQATGNLYWNRVAVGLLDTLSYHVLDCLRWVGLHECVARSCRCFGALLIVYH